MRRAALLLILVAGAGVAYAQSADIVPARADTIVSNRVEGTVFRQPPLSKTGEDALELALAGNEEGNCERTLLRRSYAEAKASGRQRPMPAESNALAAIELNAAIKVRGGGYRTCQACFGICIGISPHSTDSSASASANAVTTIVFAPSTRGRIDLAFDFALIGDGVLQIQVEDELGRSLGKISDENRSIRLDARTTAKVVIRSQLATSGSDRGTCCEVAQHSMATVQMYARPLPEDTVISFVDAMDFVPYVIGGSLETRFPQIGYVWINNGASLCTGTLVGRRTVLTAAHCVEGFEGQSMEFRLANSVNANIRSDDKYRVQGFDFPKDPSSGPAFDALILADDLALLYLDRDVSDPGSRDRLLQPLAMHTGTPEFTDVRNRALTFVGFGFSDLTSGPTPRLTENGTKRSVSMRINAESRKTFRNRAPGQNTCRGDSGGPALLLTESGDPVIVGVISGGDQLCVDYGNNTRLDAYESWIRGKIR